MADPTITTQPPRRTPRKGGIVDVADFRTDDRLAAGVGTVYDADSCTVDLGEINLCYAPDVSPSAKVGEGIVTGDGIVPTFGGYVGVECFIGPWDDYVGRARAALEQSEGRFIESVLGPWLTAGVAVAATSLADAIAKLEQHADANYVGAPVLHLSRQNAVLAASQFLIFADQDASSGRLWTANGTPVVASGAYAAGDVRMSGGITVLTSEITVTEGLDITHNTNLAVAERAYNIIVDCDYRTVATITPVP